MEFFNKAKAVRLRSYHEKFLIADEDEETVRQSHNGSSRRAHWTIEFIQGNSHLIRLKSVYGNYLTASNDPFLLGMTGKKVLQTFPVSEKDNSIDWEPITEGFYVKLRARGGKFLRANGGTPPWRNSITHDIPRRTATQDWVLWKVEMVDILEFDSVHDYISPDSSFSSSFSSDFAGSECLEIESPVVDSVSSTRHNRLSSIRENAMEFFEKAKVIRLRSHHEKYLLAEDDEENVTQDRNGTIENAKWTIEIVEDAKVLRLKSCYGKYLTASNMPFFLGMTGKKVLQTIPRRLDSSVEWEPIREGVQIKLRTRYGQFLRANAGLPPWRNHITHDIPHRSSTQDWILWDIDVVEIRRRPDPLPPPPPPPHLNNQPDSPTAIWLTSAPTLSRTESDGSIAGIPIPMKNEGRLIHYNVANEKGQTNENEKLSFTFKGNGVEELKLKLEEETGLDDILVCSRNPLNGKLYPLRLHLPPNNATMNVVVVPSSGKGASNIAQPESPVAI